jgi:hypothetical protein
VQLGPGRTGDRTVRVWLDRRYTESMELQQVTPQPDTMEAGGERLIFTFRRVAGEGPTAITFDLRPNRFGSLFGRIGLIDGPALQFHQFIYP